MNYLQMAGKNSQGRSREPVGRQNPIAKTPVDSQIDWTTGQCMLGWSAELSSVMNQLAWCSKKWADPRRARSEPQACCWRFLLAANYRWQCPA